MANLISIPNLRKPYALHELFLEFQQLERTSAMKNGPLIERSMGGLPEKMFVSIASFPKRTSGEFHRTYRFYSDGSVDFVERGTRRYCKTWEDGTIDLLHFLIRSLESSNDQTVATMLRADLAETLFAPQTTPAMT